MLTILLTLCLALATVAGDDKTIDGTVVDAKGKPIAGVEVVGSLGVMIDGSIPVDARAKTDETGRFQLAAPTLEQMRSQTYPKITIWANVPGRGIAVNTWYPTDQSSARKIRLDLDKPSKRVIKIETSDGKPLVARARASSLRQRRRDWTRLARRMEGSRRRVHRRERRRSNSRHYGGSAHLRRPRRASDRRRAGFRL